MPSLIFVLLYCIFLCVITTKSIRQSNKMIINARYIAKGLLVCCVVLVFFYFVGGNNIQVLWSALFCILVWYKCAQYCLEFCTRYRMLYCTMYCRLCGAVLCTVWVHVIVATLYVQYGTVFYIAYCTLYCMHNVHWLLIILNTFCCLIDLFFILHLPANINFCNKSTWM